MRIRFTGRGRTELLQQIDWLSERSPRAARAASERIRSTLAWLADYPRAAPLIDTVHRDAAVHFGRDGFFVRYRLQGEDLIIVRVFHGRQAR